MQSPTERTTENESMLKTARAERLVADAKRLLLEAGKDADGRFAAGAERILRAVEEVVDDPAGEVWRAERLVVSVKCLLWAAEKDAEDCALYPIDPAREKERLIAAQLRAERARQLLQTAREVYRETESRLIQTSPKETVRKRIQITRKRPPPKRTAEREAYKTLRRQTERQLLQTAERAELGAYQTPDLNPEKPARKQTTGKIKAEREARRMAEFNERSEARLAGRKLT